MVIVGGKIGDGDEYWIHAQVKSTFRQKGEKIRFLIDPSEKFTFISIPDATQNNIDYKTFTKGKFEISGTEIEVYIYPNCTLFLHHNDGKPYDISLEKVLIPVEFAFKDQIRAGKSRVGSDFIDSFNISYKNDKDGDMILLDPKSTNT